MLQVIDQANFFASEFFVTKNRSVLIPRQWFYCGITNKNHIASAFHVNRYCTYIIWLSHWKPLVTLQHMNTLSNMRVDIFLILHFRQDVDQTIISTYSYHHMKKFSPTTRLLIFCASEYYSLTKCTQEFKLIMIIMYIYIEYIYPVISGIYFKTQCNYKLESPIPNK